MQSTYFAYKFLNHFSQFAYIFYSIFPGCVVLIKWRRTVGSFYWLPILLFSKPNIFRAFAGPRKQFLLLLPSKTQHSLLKVFQWKRQKGDLTNTRDIFGLENKTKKTIIHDDLCLPFYLLYYFTVVPANNNVDFVFFLMLELTAEAASAIWWPDFPHISPEAFPHFLPFGTRIRIEKKDTFCR